MAIGNPGLPITRWGIFDTSTVSSWEAYRVNPDGNAPKGLSVGSLVVTNGGTYIVNGIRSDGSYEGLLVNPYINSYNYTGKYVAAPDINKSTSQIASGDTGSLRADDIEKSAEKFNMINNYIYLYHLDKFIVLPEYPDSVQDSMPANFAQSTPIGRSAPIFSYKSSGPRTVQVNFSFHRELMHSLNLGISNVVLGLGEDYVDTLLKYLQASVLPTYESAKKMINPPMVAMRLGNDIFVKGIIEGNIGLTYHYPILKNDKYALVDVAWTVAEMDPYDAKIVAQAGSYRGISTSLERAWVNYYNSYYNESKNTINVG